jgi:hypothetical protein
MIANLVNLQKELEILEEEFRHTVRLFRTYTLLWR